MTPDPDPTAGRLAELERLARAATPGPWEAEHRCHGRTAADDEAGGLGLEVRGPEPATDRGQFARGADAAFIAAAHPGTVLALVERVRELEAENARLRAAPEARP
jgi:hypothetical protein